jgi:hypothetical protein
MRNSHSKSSFCLPSTNVFCNDLFPPWIQFVFRKLLKCCLKSTSYSLFVCNGSQGLNLDHCLLKRDGWIHAFTNLSLHSPHKSCLLLTSSIKTAGESSINIAKRSSEKMDLSMIITSLKKMATDTNYKNFLLSSLENWISQWSF